MRQRYVGLYRSGGPTVGLEITLPSQLNKLPHKVTRKLPGLIRRIALAGKNFWKSEAGRRLKTSRKRYQEAVDFDILGSLDAVIAISDTFAADIEFGAPGFDMKPGFMKGAKPWGRKRKFPRDIRHLLREKSTIQMYRVIPLNTSRYVTMAKPKMFRTVHDQSTIALSGPNSGKAAWQHPGLKGAKILPDVFTELSKNIIPKMLDEFMKENL